MKNKSESKKARVVNKPYYVRSYIQKKDFRITAPNVATPVRMIHTIRKHLFIYRYIQYMDQLATQSFIQ